jgi:hypothetical protein
MRPDHQTIKARYPWEKRPVNLLRLRLRWQRENASREEIQWAEQAVEWKEVVWRMEGVKIVQLKHLQALARVACCGSKEVCLAWVRWECSQRTLGVTSSWEHLQSEQALRRRVSRMLGVLEE